ncbi:MAG: NADH-quinone oxidoreductase subunit NuoE [Oscillospiraceae bacterium]|jgi:NADH:ubiquinone oxidoreductase subunit E|nr:NADH-quinone oxidoreductase subunit NuoE [Oscillospiraceae bacterium]
MTDTKTKQAKREEQFAKLAEAIQNHKGERGALMPVLQEAQSIFGFVPQDVQVEIAKGLDVPLTEVYGVATFYSQFALEAQGEHIIGLCLGTACYVRGAQKILDRLSSELNVKVGHSTNDGQFTLNATRCLGACGLAPVMMIDEEVYGRLTSDEIPAILAKYRAPKAS